MAEHEGVMTWTVSAGLVVGVVVVGWCWCCWGCAVPRLPLQIVPFPKETRTLWGRSEYISATGRPASPPPRRTHSGSVQKGSKSLLNTQTAASSAGVWPYCDPPTSKQHSESNGIVQFVMSPHTLWSRKDYPVSTRLSTFKIRRQTFDFFKFLSTKNRLKNEKNSYILTAETWFIKLYSWATLWVYACTVRVVV